MRTVRRVVDSNYLRDRRLAAYLAGSPRHIAVLTELVLVEAYKREPLTTLPASLEILARYPRQVAVLKPSEQQLGFRGRAAGLQKRLIDMRMTAEFPKLCARIEAAAAGDSLEQSRILEAARIATNHMERLVEAAPTVIQLFEIHARRFNGPELTGIARRRPYSPATQTKLIRMIVDTTVEVAQATGAVSRRTNLAEIVNLPVFRYCLCMALLFTHWVAGGRQRATKPAKTANDVVDANVAAYATYFDGVLSADAKMLSLHGEARHFLREIGASISDANTAS